MSVVILFGLGGISLCWIWLNHKFLGDALSPFSIVFFSWTMPLALRTLGLSTLERPWDISIVVVLVVITFELTLISLIAVVLAMKYSQPEIQRWVIGRLVSLFSRPSFRVMLFLFWGVAFIAYVYAEFLTNPGGIPLITSLTSGTVLVGDIHRWGKDTRWSIITPLLWILTPMLFLAFRTSKGWNAKMFFAILTASYPLMGLLKISRSDLFISALGIVVVEYYYRRYSPTVKKGNLGLWKIAFLAGVGLTILYVTITVRMGGDIESNRYGDSIGFVLSDSGIADSLLAQIYGYLALPFENLHRFLVDYEGGFSPGISVFRPVLSIVGLGNVADEMATQIPFTPPVSSAAGSATFLTPIYAELGLFGLITIPVIYASLVNIIYIRARMRPNYLNLFLYIVFLYPWSWLYFNNAFSVLTIYINAMFVVGTAIVISTYTSTGRPKTAIRSRDEIALRANVQQSSN